MVKVVSLAMARDGAIGGVVRTVTVSSLFLCNFLCSVPFRNIETQQSPKLFAYHGLSYVMLVLARTRSIMLLIAFKVKLNQLY